jgi:hypothetical protein
VLLNPVLPGKKKAFSLPQRDKTGNAHPDLALLVYTDGKLSGSIAADIKNPAKPFIIQYILRFLHPDWSLFYNFNGFLK